MSEVQELARKIKEFITERGWEKYQNPKDVALSLTLEAAEVLEHFQWKNGEELTAYLETRKEDLADEIADFFIYLLQLCEKLSIDLVAASYRKIEKNGRKYLVQRS